MAFNPPRGPSNGPRPPSGRGRGRSRGGFGGPERSSRPPAPPPYERRRSSSNNLTWQRRPDEDESEPPAPARLPLFRAPTVDTLLGEQEEDVKRPISAHTPYTAADDDAIIDFCVDNRQLVNNASRVAAFLKQPIALRHSEESWYARLTTLTMQTRLRRELELPQLPRFTFNGRSTSEGPVQGSSRDLEYDLPDPQRERRSGPSRAERGASEVQAGEQPVFTAEEDEWLSAQMAEHGLEEDLDGVFKYLARSRGVGMRHSAEHWRQRYESNPTRLNGVTMRDHIVTLRSQLPNTSPPPAAAASSARDTDPEEAQARPVQPRNVDELAATEDETGTDDATKVQRTKRKGFTAVEEELAAQTKAKHSDLNATDLGKLIHDTVPGGKGHPPTSWANYVRPSRDSGGRVARRAEEIKKEAAKKLARAEKAAAKRAAGNAPTEQRASGSNDDGGAVPAKRASKVSDAAQNHTASASNDNDGPSKKRFRRSDASNDSATAKQVSHLRAAFEAVASVSGLDLIKTDDIASISRSLVAAGVRDFADLSLTPAEGQDLFTAAGLPADQVKNLVKLLKLKSSRFKADAIDDSLYEGKLEPLLAALHPSLANAAGLFKGTVQTVAELAQFQALHLKTLLAVADATPLQRTVLLARVEAVRPFFEK